MGRKEASEEQGILPEETKDEEELDRKLGEKDEEVYDEEGREQLLEDDEISPEEEGFMEGAQGRGSHGKCAHCHEVLEEDVVEREYKGRIRVFCSEKCAEAGPIGL